MHRVPSAPSIRRERPGDDRAIHRLVSGCFPTPAEAGLVDRLRTRGRLAISLVAEADGAVVGHIAFSSVATPARGSVDPPGVGLAPLSVDASWRRRGIGGALIRAGLEASAGAGFGWCVVLGEPGYYARFGFGPAADYGLRDEYAGGDAFQAVALRRAGLPRDAGLVRYAPEFAGLG